MATINDPGKLIGALLIGTAIGGALGILFAPNKGSETRKKITHRSDDLSDTMKEKFNDFIDEVNKKSCNS